MLAQPHPEDRGLPRRAVSAIATDSCAVLLVEGAVRRAG